jgi:hypothetical protein
MKNMLITLIIVVFALSVGYISYVFLGADNPVEEECEKVVKDQIGLSIDISKSSDETKPS